MYDIIDMKSNFTEGYWWGLFCGSALGVSGTFLAFFIARIILDQQ